MMYDIIYSLLVLTEKLVFFTAVRVYYILKLIYNGNIFHIFKKVIASLNHSKIEAIKALEVNFTVNRRAT